MLRLLTSLFFLFNFTAYSDNRSCNSALTQQSSQSVTESNELRAENILALVDSYERIFEISDAATEAHLETTILAALRGSDQYAFYTQNRLSIEALKDAITTGNIEAAVIELQKTWLPVETAFLRRMQDQKMLEMLENVLRDNHQYTDSVVARIAAIKLRQLKSDKTLATLFGLYKAQREYLEAVAEGGTSVDPRSSLEDDQAITQIRTDVVSEAVLLASTPEAKTDPLEFSRANAQKILQRVGLVAILAKPSEGSKSEAQNLIHIRPSIEDMSNEFVTSSDLSAMRRRHVIWQERKAAILTYLTHKSFASTRMKISRSMPTKAQGIIRWVLMLRSESYKRRVHVPQILSILDSNPSNYQALTGVERDTAIMSKLVLLLKYSARNNDKDDLLNTMARTEETRELWREMKTIALKLHQNEANTRRDALVVDNVELKHTIWGHVVIRMDQATKEAMSQGGFSLTYRPSQISALGSYTERTIRLALPYYLEHYHDFFSGYILDLLLK